MDRSGLSANDGPTHHGLFDIAYLRCLPNVVAMAPANEDELTDMMFTATHQNHPAFIRYPRGTAEGVPIKEAPKLLEIGKAEIVRHFSNNGKKKIAIFGLGNMNSLAGKAAAQLAAEDFDCAVINPRFTKPLDAGTHEFFGQTADLIVTMEDHVLMGGYGSSVLELFSEKNVKTAVVRIGWPDQFIEHATSQDELRKRYGLTVENTVAKVKELFSEPAETAAATGLPAAI
jgi:1-deoxy-D-xylulose-5-phosphate synthase